MNTNKIMPSMVLSDGQIKPLSKLSIVDRLAVNNHSKNDIIIRNRPLLQKYLSDCEMRIIKLYTGFTAEEYNLINKKANEQGLYIQPNVKDFIPTSSHFACIYLSSKDIIKEFLQERGIYEAFMNNVKDVQKNTRLSKILGEWIEVPIKPKILVTPDLKDFNGTHTHEGCIIMSAKYAEECNKKWLEEYNKLSNEEKALQKGPYHIVPSTKTSFILKSLIFITENLKDVDIIIPESENKLKLSAEQIANNFAINPSISSETTFSRNLFKDKKKTKRNRLPEICIDTMFLCNAPEYTKKLKFIKDIYEEKIKGKLVADKLFSYYDVETGKMKYNTFGEKILAGESIHSPEIWKFANKLLVNAIHKSLKPTTNGFYGNVMPLRFLPQLMKQGYKVETYNDGALIRYPATVPIKCEVKVCKDILFVDEVLWTKVFNGDSDGDFGFYLRSKTLPIFFDWRNDKDSQELLQLCQFDSVEKSKSKVQIDMIQSQFYTAETQKTIGQVYNRNKAVMIAYIYAGVSPKIITKMDMYNCSTLVQQAIDSLKYDVNSQEEITIKYIIDYCEANISKFGISELPKLNDTLIAKARKFFRAAKSENNIENIIKVAKEANPKSNVIYERIVSHFKDWKYDAK